MDWDYLGNMDKTDSTWFHPLWRIPLLTVNIAPLGRGLKCVLNFRGPSTAINSHHLLVDHDPHRILSFWWRASAKGTGNDESQKKHTHTHDLYKLILSPIKNKIGQTWSHLNIHRIFTNIIIWVWVDTYRYSFSGMNIHLPAILGFTRYQGPISKRNCLSTLELFVYHQPQRNHRNQREVYLATRSAQIHWCLAAVFRRAEFHMGMGQNLWIYHDFWGKHIQESAILGIFGVPRAYRVPGLWLTTKWWFSRFLFENVSTRNRTRDPPFPEFRVASRFNMDGWKRQSQCPA